MVKSELSNFFEKLFWFFLKIELLMKYAMEKITSIEKSQIPVFKTFKPSLDPPGGCFRGIHDWGWVAGGLLYAPRGSAKVAGASEKTAQLGKFSWKTALGIAAPGEVP